MTLHQTLALAQALEPTRQQVIAHAAQGHRPTCGRAAQAGVSEAWVSWVVSTWWHQQVPRAYQPVHAHRVYRPRRGSRAA